MDLKVIIMLILKAQLNSKTIQYKNRNFPFLRIDNEPAAAVKAIFD